MKVEKTWKEEARGYSKPKKIREARRKTTREELLAFAIDYRMHPENYDIEANIMDQLKEMTPGELQKLKQVIEIIPEENTDALTQLLGIDIFKIMKSKLENY